MFGSTETSRAVSYYEIPSQAKDPDLLDKLKETVPAGKDMENVQLLVVNRKDRTRLCEIGEVGDIYVRAAGLAEYYAGDQVLNEDLTRWNSLTKTERTVVLKWANLIRGLNAKSIAPQNDFFDLGGHSLLAQQMLLKIRKEIGADVFIKTLYENPSLSGLSSQVDRLLRPTAVVNGESLGGQEEDSTYAKLLNELLNQLPATYQTADPATILALTKPTVFLTGATGFLGGFIIRDILERTSAAIRLIAHVRAAKDSEAALDRLRRSLQSYGLWNDD
ncbi:MAG: hypothetical protein Q9166_004372 [cf. Caloplaca sp. 2 TL-2023]